MTDSVVVLSGAAGSIAVLHTLLGPDHYLPFIAMSRAGKWSLRKTLTVTLLCGMGHVVSSAALALVGVFFGFTVLGLDRVQAFRAELAGWLLLAFGCVYFVWGLRRAIRNKPHSHWHAHPEGIVHTHEHLHVGQHMHVHVASGSGDETSPDAKTLTPWVLFVIFVFGPCEPLIPILMYPAAQNNPWGAACVTIVFALATLTTMSTVVIAAYLGIGSIRFARLERYSHAVAGLMVAACGVALHFGR